MDLDGPVLHFRLPVFDAQTGYRAWDIQGREGLRVGEAEVEVKDLVIRIYHPGGIEVETTITSPQARLHLGQGEARGDSPLRVDGANFILQGEDWQWDHDRQRIRVARLARVTFTEPLGSLLE